MGFLDFCYGHAKHGFPRLIHCNAIMILRFNYKSDYRPFSLFSHFLATHFHATKMLQPSIIFLPDECSEEEKIRIEWGIGCDFTALHKTALSLSLCLVHESLVVCLDQHHQYLIEPKVSWKVNAMGWRPEAQEISIGQPLLVTQKQMI